MRRITVSSQARIALAAWQARKRNQRTTVAYLNGTWCQVRRLRSGEITVAFGQGITHKTTGVRCDLWSGRSI